MFARPRRWERRLLARVRAVPFVGCDLTRCVRRIFSRLFAILFIPGNRFHFRVNGDHCIAKPVELVLASLSVGSIIIVPATGQRPSARGSRNPSNALRHLRLDARVLPLPKIDNAFMRQAAFAFKKNREITVDRLAM